MNGTVREVERACVQNFDVERHAIPQLESLGIFGESPTSQDIMGHHGFSKILGISRIFLKPTLAKKIYPRAGILNIKKRTPDLCARQRAERPELVRKQDIRIKKHQTS
jgi:hypothetical protein